MEGNMTNTELEERLISFAVLIVGIVDKLQKTKTGNHFSGQLLRSGTSPALNYGEVRGAESKKDFIHKLQVVLKELRETYNCLKIIDGAKISITEQSIKKALNECNELISIFVITVKTARKNG